MVPMANPPMNWLAKMVLRAVCPNGWTPFWAKMALMARTEKMARMENLPMNWPVKMDLKAL